MKTKTFVIEENEPNISTFDLFDALIKNKSQLAIVFLLTSVITYTSLQFIPNKYTAETLLVVNELSTKPKEDPFSLIPGIGSQINNPLEVKAKALLTSKSFFMDFVDRRKIVIPLIESRGWDESENIIFTNFGDYSIPFNSEAKNDSNMEYLQDNKIMHAAYIEWRKNILKVKSDPLTGFYTVSITHHSPNFSKNVVDWLVEDINNSMRELEINQSNRALETLEAELANNILPDMKNVISSLIRENMQRKTLASSTEDYIFTILDPAYKPEFKSSPKRLLILIATLFLVFSIHSLFILFKFFKLRKSNE